MTEEEMPNNNGDEIEQYPIEPRFHPVSIVARRIFDQLASAKLAMLLLVAILVSCLFGGMLLKGDAARQYIYGSLWFNGLLVLLVTNTACCFFGRMWGRRLTVVSFGMILFHLSFVVMFLAIVFNSLFSFNGILRLTEGETLSNRDPKSYDVANPGLFFSYARLKGETTLLKVHRGYRIDGVDKKIAYDIVIADGGIDKPGTIYINNKFEYKGVDYIRDQEGYSLLVIANDRQGRVLHGMHIPLQSYIQKNGTYVYGSGSKAGPGWFGFPPINGSPLFNLQLEYLIENRNDRDGRVRFKVWPIPAAGGHTGSPVSGGMHGSGGQTENIKTGTEAHGSVNTGASSPHGIDGMNVQPGGGMSGSAGGGMHNAGSGQIGRPAVDATVNVAEKVAYEAYQLVAPEVRYWVSMNVRYNPGKPVVLASLWVGLAGMIITTFGRILKRRR